jgi:hypothetical protein
MARPRWSATPTLRRTRFDSTRSTMSSSCCGVGVGAGLRGCARTPTPRQTLTAKAAQTSFAGESLLRRLEGFIARNIARRFSMPGRAGRNQAEPTPAGTGKPRGRKKYERMFSRASHGRPTASDCLGARGARRVARRKRRGKGEEGKRLKGEKAKRKKRSGVPLVLPLRLFPF